MSSLGQIQLAVGFFPWLEVLHRHYAQLYVDSGFSSDVGAPPLSPVSQMLKHSPIPNTGREPVIQGAKAFSFLPHWNKCIHYLFLPWHWLPHALQHFIFLQLNTALSWREELSTMCNVRSRKILLPQSGLKRGGTGAKSLKPAVPEGPGPDKRNYTVTQ